MGYGRVFSGVGYDKYGGPFFCHCRCKQPTLNMDGWMDVDTWAMVFWWWNLID